MNFQIEKSLKANWRDLITLIPSTFFLALNIFFLSLFPTKEILWGTLGVNVLLFILVFSFIFECRIFESGERKMSNNLSVIELEKEHYGMMWGYVGAAGFAFLIPGIQEINDPIMWMIITALLLFIVSSIVYTFFYFPRYRHLVREKIVKKLLETKWVNS